MRFRGTAPNRPLTPFVVLASLQNRMPLHEFVVACAPPKEQPLFRDEFKDLRSSTSTAKNLWLDSLNSWVCGVTVTEFDESYLKPLHHPVMAAQVKGALAPYFKTGVAALLLPNGPCDRLCACAVACADVADSRMPVRSRCRVSKFVRVLGRD